MRNYKHKNSLVQSILVLIVAAVAVSCSSSEVPEPEILDELFSIEAKKFRVSKTVYYNPEGEEVRTVTDTAFYDMDTLINGQVWYGQVGGTQVFRNGDDGFYTYLKPLDIIYLVYKYPATSEEYYATKSFQGASYQNDGPNPFNVTDYNMLVVSTKATADMKFTDQSYDGLIHYKKEEHTVSTNGFISPAEWFIKPGLGTVCFKAYFDEGFQNLQVYSETLLFL
ncbi:hypothetical protein [uncultured Arcticibacterium sp.]|uniref:hypothetical protein n=1 Tax=uncultured Arcticibacterium sp. TaxID=2173042 RepID=UPI0030FA8595